MDGGDRRAARGAHPGADTQPAPAPPTGRLPLVVTIGFTGHRSLDDIDEATAQIDVTLAAAHHALKLLAATTLRGAGDERLQQAYDGSASLRLLTGDAPGADGLVIDRWGRAGMGETHRLYPYRDPDTGEALTDRPERATDEVRRSPPADEPWTGIDAVSLGLGADQAHAEVTRWIVRHSQVLMALWDGDQMTKPGGTGDTVRRALERGVPVIWLQPGERRIRLANPASAHRHGGVPDSAEGLDAISTDLTPERLARLLEQTVAPPGAIRSHARDPEVIGRQDYARVDPLAPWPGPFRLLQSLLDHTVWQTYRQFEHLAGGAAARAPTGRSQPPPASLAAQPGFAYLRDCLGEAATRANKLSAIHRSNQLLLIVLATLAVVCGAAPALSRLDPQVVATQSWVSATVPPAGRHPVQQLEAGEVNSHAIAALLELCLVLLAVGIAALAGRYHRHRRWSDARRLAERLRAARATWPLGVSIADAQLVRPHGWTDWRADAVLRAAGPRRGWIDEPAFREAAAWVTADLLDGQIAYHTREFHLSARIGGVIRWAERISFVLLLGTLSGYLIGLAINEQVLHRSLPFFVGNWVTVVSSICPAIGAACIALEATSGFGDLEQRSERLQHEFRHIREELEEDEGMRYHHVQEVIRRGAQLLVDESGVWRDQVARRRLVRT
ncbi:MAG TPA: hypothetical protein VME40_09785 [Caulobacteraceae bacterium]|nr:hypothetical protein [Caulobacteraceae bacterium]